MTAKRRRHKCSTCGLYVGANPHSRAAHARIKAAQRRIARLGRRR